MTLARIRNFWDWILSMSSCSNRRSLDSLVSRMNLSTRTSLSKAHTSLLKVDPESCAVSRGASGGCLHGGASFKVEKAHFAARKKGPESRKHEVELRPPLCRPLKHSMTVSLFQKNPRVCKIRVRNSGAGNGCANFMDTWKNAFFLQEKPVSIKFLLLGGGYFGFGGGGVPILFLWARGFF